MPSSGYSAPELQRWKILSELPEHQRRGATVLELEATEALDVWGFGASLFHLCTGEELFTQNIMDNEITRSSDEMRK